MATGSDPNYLSAGGNMLRVVLLFFTIVFINSAELRWLHLSSSQNQLPVPSSTAKVSAGSLVGDFNRDKTNDFILAFSDAAPSLVLYRGATNWSTITIEHEQLPIARGGAALDIDRDGDQDIVFGSDTGPEIWWWENPNPNFNPSKSWTRRTIKNSGSEINRGQFAVDLSGAGWPQLLFWNQGSNTLHHAPIPSEVQKQTNWTSTPLFSLPMGSTPGTIENLTALDLNIDGLIDLIVGNYWLKRGQGFSFEPTRIGQIQGRSAVGRFRDSTFPQIVIAPQTSRGRVYWYECKTSPDKSESWAGRQLLGHDIAPAASLAIADLDQDGNDDIFLAELQEPSQTSTEHWPNSWIFLSDGNGSFRSILFNNSLEIFDAKMVDLDGDSDLDIVSTPHRSSSSSGVDLWLNITEFTAPPTAPE